MINNRKNLEILAPCGSYDILVTAVKAGADACYIGGSKFGARAYAQNFDTDSIIKAIDYSHIHGTKLYLTVNTLFKNNEMKELYNYLLPYYRAGLDAVIVQDLGVFRYIKEAFPDINIHCSTQMNITSSHAAAYMRRLGASRVVTAREMSLEEIKELKSEVDIEVETFVHGAMCYSYSGQCLMSSLAGGRSGNRGRCAQPCRKCYDGKYILSMKDMCTLEMLPQLIGAGIDSLKIEGRMKNEYYVASTVSAYREMADDCIAGRFSINKAKELKFRLANIFNRGGFSNGYFFCHNGADMISGNRPNNQGVKIGELIKVQNGSITIKLIEKLYKGDVLEVGLKDKTAIDITSGISGREGDCVTLNAPKTKMVLPKQDIYRTRCNAILRKLDEEIHEGTDRYLGLRGEFTGIVGKPLRLDLSRNIAGTEYRVSAHGGIVEVSEKHPADEGQIRSKLSQLGNTEYRFDMLDVRISKNAFIPAGMVKQLRREAIELLEQKISDSCRRDNAIEIPLADIKYKKASKDTDIRCIPVKVGVISTEQLNIILDYGNIIYGIYMDAELYNSIKETNYLRRIKELGIKLYIELPYIIRNRFDINKYLPNASINGIYIRNIDGLSCLKDIDNKSVFEDNDFEIISGASLYGYNNQAVEFIKDICGKVIVEVPRELNIKECRSIAAQNNEMVIYEHQPVMLSAQCIQKNKDKCNHNNSIIKITDDRNNSFYSRAICGECCNVIYNGVPFYMLDKVTSEMAGDLNIRYFKACFTVEAPDTVRKIMDIVSELGQGKEVGSMLEGIHGVHTSGHYYRGVE